MDDDEITRLQRAMQAALADLVAAVGLALVGALVFEAFVGGPRLAQVGAVLGLLALQFGRDPLPSREL